MKTLFTTLLLWGISWGAIQAQDTSYFFPDKDGAQLIHQCYDAKNNLISTTTLTVRKETDSVSNPNIVFYYIVADSTGSTIKQGEVRTSYQDGYFILNLSDRAMINDFSRYLNMNTEIQGGFLDYPNIFSPTSWNKEFLIEAGQIKIKSKENHREIARVNLYDRDFIKSEDITTPAGIFNAGRIAFSVDVYENQQRKIFHGKEWYAMGTGIVRSEIYDQNKNLINYTVLTTIKE